MGQEHSERDGPTPEAPKWPDFVVQYKQTVDALDAESMFQHNEEVVEFAQQLESNFPYARDHQFFHLLIGSRADNKPNPEDFPGEYSIETFMRDFVTKQSQNKRLTE